MESLGTPPIEYGNGCLSNQLVGQTWASQLDLGELYPHDQIVTTLRSIYHYNWTPDVAYDKNYPNVGPRHKEYPTILSSPCRAKRGCSNVPGPTVIRPPFRFYTTPWYLRGPSSKWPR